MITVIPELLDAAALAEVLQALAEASFVDGKKTAGYRAKTVKENEQLAPGGDHPARRLVLKALRANQTFKEVALAKSIRSPLISRYRPGMAYGYHVDDAMMGAEHPERSDISVTVFLNDPDDYEGGELEILSGFGPSAAKLPAGAALVYPASTLHRVCPVTRGERLVAVTWAQSLVRDVAKREILHDLLQVQKRLHALEPEGAATNLAFKTRSNLLRLWSES